MRHYYEIGEKKFLDKHGRKIFAIDNKNSMLLLEINVKLFPVLNHNILYIAMIIHEKIDDIIFLDSKYNIQGMSQKLFNKFKILNQNIFNENNIPFYTICKQFINFYKTFLKGNRKKLSPLATINTSSQILSDKESFEDYLLNDKEKEKEREILEQENNENIEINENIELEYEIKIPKFILDYSFYTLHKEKTIQVDFSESNSLKVIGENFFNGTDFESISLPTSVTTIKANAFVDNKSTTKLTVYYAGTEEDFNKITIDSSNSKHYTVVYQTN
jgi:hypothetical protein